MRGGPPVQHLEVDRIRGLGLLRHVPEQAS